MSPLVIALIVSVPFILVLVLEPVLRKTAWRNAAQRPREAILVATGSLLGAAIITGSFVVGDTFDHSLERRVYRELGTIDEVVAFQSPEVWTEGQVRLENLPAPPFDGVTPLGLLAVPASTNDADPRSAPQAQLIEVDFDEARSLGPPPISGVAGPTPGQGEAAISAQLADRLGLAVGDEVRTYPYGRRVDFEVVRILPQVGLAGLRLGESDVADNLLVAPGTVQRLVEQAEGEASLELAPAEWLIAVSNTGGVEDGVALTDTASAELRRRLQGLTGEVVPAKRRGLDSALASGAFLGQYLDTMGVFGVFAGVLLLVNVFVMMGEERMPELGSMRAVGMNRGAVVAAFSTEGWIYSVAGCALGALGGVGLGWVMVRIVSGLFPPEDEAYGMALEFAARPLSSQSGFAYGLLISVVAVFLTSWRISRLDVIQAIRSLPQNKRRDRGSLLAPAAGSLGVAFGALVTAIGIAQEGQVATMLGPVMLLLGLVPLLRRVASTRTLMTLAALGVVLWAVVGRLFVGPAPENPIAMIVQGVSMVAAAVVLVTLQQHQLGRLLRRVGSGRRGVTARMALAYPLARPTRTALTLAPFCMIIFTLAFISSLSKLFTEELKSIDEKVGGGYDVIVGSSRANPLPFDEIADRDDVEAVAPVATVDAAFVASESQRPLLSTATGFDATLIENGRAPQLFDRGPFPDDAAAYRAVLENPDLAIVPSDFLDDYSGTEEFDVMRPGFVLSIVDPATAQARQLEVAAVASADILDQGAFLSQASLRDLVGGRAVSSGAFVATSDPEAFARDVEREYIPYGARVETFEELASDVLELVSQIVNVFWTYMGVGLIVGVAGVAVMMVRAVRERRRQIGVLRSLGFEAGMIGRSFLLEAGFVAVAAVVLGIGLAVATVVSITHSAELRAFLGLTPQFTPATATLAALGAATIIAALVATAGPARAASAIPPSEALRLVD